MDKPLLGGSRVMVSVPHVLVTAYLSIVGSIICCSQDFTGQRFLPWMLCRRSIERSSHYLSATTGNVK